LARARRASSRLLASSCVRRPGFFAMGTSGEGADLRDAAKPCWRISHEPGTLGVRKPRRPLGAHTGVVWLMDSNRVCMSCVHA
jgi:hypothetical protein